MVKLGHSVAFGVVHPISEDGCLLIYIGSVYCVFQHSGESVALEDVVAKDEAYAVVADEVGTDGEGLCQSVGRWLFGISEMHSVITAVAQQTLESRQVERCGDYKDVADAGKHQHTDGIIYHRLVVDGHELLADAFGDWIQAGA